jgi:alpha-glucosidase
VAKYFGRGDELHLAFDFTPLVAPWDAAAWRQRIVEAESELGALGAWPTWTLSNHDNPRHPTRYGGGEARARAAAVLLLTLRGAPFVYYGEELGLTDAVVPPERVVDPGGRDACRSPLPWSPDPGHGWPGPVEPWLPWSPDPDVRNVETQGADPGSTLNLYRRLTAARRASPALARGSIKLLPAPEGVLAYERREGDDRRVVAVNFTSAGTQVDLTGAAWAVEVDSSDRQLDGGPFDGRLGPDQAVVLRPA